MTKELANDLAFAIIRRSSVLADRIGLSLTMSELQWVYDKVAVSRVLEKLSSLYMPMAPGDDEEPGEDGELPGNDGEVPGNGDDGEV